ncbi:hypothetical protein BSZ39_10570 [Bowdeniella nasicola]|uniref:Uncharacterized protein n=1 Tax=Bowdeniella nasicola TaxID=208480 RepID=A0A1Q5Q037_9ACTO|nr:hypothetical protein [Bowdeniella nasicola]OKL53241.1 hypothetical protein BSZ39_10570 [Bowdeniella nasicola]
MATTSKSPPARRILAFLFLPLMLLLASCEMKAHTEFFEDDTSKTSMEMSLPKQQAEMFGMANCDAMKKQIDKQNGGKAAEETVVEDKSDDTNVRCVISSKEAQPISEMNSDGRTVEHKDGKFIVTSKADTSADAATAEAMFGAANFSFRFTFPGKVESVEGDVPEDSYTIDGNSVEFTKISAMTKQFTITAADKAGGAGGSLLWIILGVLAALLILGALAFFFLKNRNKSADPAESAPYGGPADAQASPYGAPAPATYGEDALRPAHEAIAPAEEPVAPADPEAPLSQYDPNVDVENKPHEGSDPVLGYKELRADEGETPRS